jgi:hypothetical protein
VNVAESLEVDQTINFVAEGEAGCESVLVFEDALLQIAGHADVEGLRAVGEDVDVVEMHRSFVGRLSRSESLRCLRMTAREGARV